MELLTGEGLGLFWPPWAQFCDLRAQVQHSQNQHSKPRSRTDDNSEPLSSGVSWGSAESWGVSETVGHSQWPRNGRKHGLWRQISVHISALMLPVDWKTVSFLGYRMGKIRALFRGLLGGP